MESGIQTIADLIRRGCVRAGVDPERRPIARVGVFALAGADFPDDERRLGRALAGRGWTRTDVVRNDTFAVLRAGTDRSWGVAVVSGAGMNCVGVSPNGRVVRFPALGAISGDWGDGRDIGFAALAAAVRARDGRGSSTILERVVPEHFGLPTPGALVAALHNGRIEKDRVRELPPLVFQADRQGDRVAGAIIDRLGDEVVAMSAAAIRRLRLTDVEVDVVLGGGLLQNSDGRLIDRVGEGVRAVAPRARVIRIMSPPIAGAALLAFDRLGAPAATHARARRGLAEWAARQGRRRTQR
jgi:N-acetylglucosamine kinase-like BadF-type ATPase